MGLDVPLATCYGYCHEYTKEHGDELQPSICPNNDQDRQRIEFYMEKEAIFESKTNELGCLHPNVNRDIYDSSSKIVSSLMTNLKRLENA